MVALYYCNTTDIFIQYIQLIYTFNATILPYICMEKYIIVVHCRLCSNTHIPHQSEHGIDITEGSAGSHCLQKPEAQVRGIIIYIIDQY